MLTSHSSISGAIPFLDPLRTVRPPSGFAFDRPHEGRMYRERNVSQGHTTCVSFFLASYSWLVEARRDIPKNAFIEAELHNPSDFAKPLKVAAIELQAQDGESPW